MNGTADLKQTKYSRSVMITLLATLFLLAWLPQLAGATTFAFKPNLYGNPSIFTTSGTIPVSGYPEFAFQAFSTSPSSSGIMTDSNGWASLPTMNWAGGVATSYSGFRAFSYSSSDWMIEGFDVKNSGASTIQITVTSELKAGGTEVESFNVEPGVETIALTGHGPMAGSPIYNISTISFPTTIDLSFNNFQLSVYSAPIKATLSTTAASSIAKTTATSGGNVTDAGSGTVTARGVCWSTTVDPTTSDSKTIDGTGTGSFTSSIESLEPGTLYHVRAYATSSAGTAYGDDLTFTTQPNVIPTSTPASSSWSIAFLALAGIGGVVVWQKRVSRQA